MLTQNGIIEGDCFSLDIEAVNCSRLIPDNLGLKYLVVNVQLNLGAQIECFIHCFDADFYSLPHRRNCTFSGGQDTHRRGGIADDSDQF